MVGLIGPLLPPTALCRQQLCAICAMAVGCCCCSGFCSGAFVATVPFWCKPWTPSCYGAAVATAGLSRMLPRNANMARDRSCCFVLPTTITICHSLSHLFVFVLCWHGHP